MGGSCSNSEDREPKGRKAKQLRGSGIQAVAAEARENVEGKTRQLQHQADAPPKHVGAAAEAEADDAVAKALVWAEKSLQRAERQQALAMAEEPEIVGATLKLQRKALPPGAAWKIAHQRIRALNVVSERLLIRPTKRGGAPLEFGHMSMAELSQRCRDQGLVDQTIFIPLRRDQLVQLLVAHSKGEEPPKFGSWTTRGDQHHPTARRLSAFVADRSDGACTN